MDKIKIDIVVIGAGPGGYAAAFYAADKGKKVILIEQDKRLGGVCLNVGCIPSKALLHIAKFLDEARESKKWGVTFTKPKIELAKLRQWKESILNKLAHGVLTLSKARGVEVMYGKGYFENSNTLRVETADGQKIIHYEKAIIAVGSRPVMPQAFDLGNKRIMTSSEALELEEIPKKLLIVGGGYIGMELGTVYASLGSEITLVEALDSILIGADPDLIRPVMQYARRSFKVVRLSAKVLSMAASGKQIKVTMEYDQNTFDELYNRVLVSVGRTPNSLEIGLENTNVKLDGGGFIETDQNQQTHDESLYAIGDVAGGVLLAHKASKEARIAVQDIIGEATGHEFIVPAVVFTDPEVAWCGLTETEAKAKNLKVEVAKFTWAASGRALATDRTDGLTKLIVDPKTDRILGVGIVGTGASELISEGVVAIEMGATVHDLAKCVHPHPTLSETLMESAESFYGYATHTYSRKKQ